MDGGPSRREFALQLVRRSLAEFRADRCPQLAAAISYHVLFSIFPLAIVVAGVASIVLNSTGSRHDAVDTIVRAVPLSGSGQNDFRSLLLGATGNLSAIGLVGLLGLVYSASGMMAAIRTALNEAWDIEDVRPFLRGKLVDAGLVFAVAGLSLVSLGGTVFLHVVGGGWLGFGVVAPLIVSFGIVLFLYRIVPAVEVRLRDAWPAALFVGIGFTAIENLFAVYVRHFGNYNAIYGSLGAVIAFMFFIYVSSQLFLLGAEVASEWPRVRRALEEGAVAAEPGPPLRSRVGAAVRGLWVVSPQAAETPDDSTSRPGDRTLPDMPRKGGGGADPDRPGGDGDRGHPERVERGLGGRAPDHGHG